jgi:hypothetical protein
VGEVALRRHRVQPVLEVGQAVVAEAPEALAQGRQAARDPPGQEVGDPERREHRDDDQDDGRRASGGARGLELRDRGFPVVLRHLEVRVELLGQRVHRLVGGIDELQDLRLVAGPHGGPHLRVDRHEVGEGRLDLVERCAIARVGGIAVGLGEHLFEGADVGEEVLAARRAHKRVLGLGEMEVAGRRVHLLSDEKLLRHHRVDPVGRAREAGRPPQRRRCDAGKQRQDGAEGDRRSMT